MCRLVATETAQGFGALTKRVCALHKLRYPLNFRVAAEFCRGVGSREFTGPCETTGFPAWCHMSAI